MTECGEGKEGPCSGKEVGVGEQKVEEEVGETRDKKSFLKYLMEGEMEKGKTVKLVNGEKGVGETVEQQWRDMQQESLRLRF